MNMDTNTNTNTNMQARVARPPKARFDWLTPAPEQIISDTHQHRESLDYVIGAYRAAIDAADAVAAVEVFARNRQVKEDVHAALRGSARVLQEVLAKWAGVQL